MPSRSGEPPLRYRLPSRLRPLLAEPFGPVVASEGDLDPLVSRPLIGVGDIVSATLLRAQWNPHLVVYDGVTMRGPAPADVLRTLAAARGERVRVANPAGTISEALWMAVADAFGAGLSPWVIEVEGEEDLAGLPCLALAPLGATVIYGVPNRGLCAVRVSPEVRARAQDILSQMKV